MDGQVKRYLTGVKNYYADEVEVSCDLNNSEYQKYCKDNNKNYSPSNFNIDNTHTIDEYFAKYGKLFTKGKVLAFKKDELWLMAMLHPATVYWEIPNDSEYLYFALPGHKAPKEVTKVKSAPKLFTLRPATAALAALVLASGIAIGVAFNHIISNGGEVSPTPTPTPDPTPGPKPGPVPDIDPDDPGGGGGGGNDSGGGQANPDPIPDNPPVVTKGINIEPVGHNCTVSFSGKHKNGFFIDTNYEVLIFINNRTLFDVPTSLPNDDITDPTVAEYFSLVGVTYVPGSYSYSGPYGTTKFEIQLIPGTVSGAKVECTAKLPEVEPPAQHNLFINYESCSLNTEVSTYVPETLPEDGTVMLTFTASYGFRFPVATAADLSDYISITDADAGDAEITQYICTPKITTITKWDENGGTDGKGDYVKFNQEEYVECKVAIKMGTSNATLTIKAYEDTEGYYVIRFNTTNAAGATTKFPCTAKPNKDSYRADEVATVNIDTTDGDISYAGDGTKTFKRYTLPDDPIEYQFFKNGSDNKMLPDKVPDNTVKFVTGSFRINETKTSVTFQVVMPKLDFTISFAVTEVPITNSPFTLTCELEHYSWPNTHLCHCTYTIIDNKTEFYAGDIVRIKITPDEGYKLSGSVESTGIGGGLITITGGPANLIPEEYKTGPEDTYTVAIKFEDNITSNVTFFYECISGNGATNKTYDLILTCENCDIENAENKGLVKNEKGEYVIPLITIEKDYDYDQYMMAAIPIKFDENCEAPHTDNIVGTQQETEYLPADKAIIDARQEDKRWSRYVNFTSLPENITKESYQDRYFIGWYYPEGNTIGYLYITVAEDLLTSSVTASVKAINTEYKEGKTPDPTTGVKVTRSQIDNYINNNWAKYNPNTATSDVRYYVTGQPKIMYNFTADEDMSVSDITNIYQQSSYLYNVDKMIEASNTGGLNPAPKFLAQPYLIDNTNSDLNNVMNGVYTSLFNKLHSATPSGSWNPLTRIFSSQEFEATWPGADGEAYDDSKAEYYLDSTNDIIEMRVTKAYSNWSVNCIYRYINGVGAYYRGEIKTTNRSSGRNYGGYVEVDFKNDIVRYKNN